MALLCLLRPFEQTLRASREDRFIGPINRRRRQRAGAYSGLDDHFTLLLWQALQHLQRRQAQHIGLWRFHHQSSQDIKGSSRDHPAIRPVRNLLLRRTILQMSNHRTPLAGRFASTRVIADCRCAATGWLPSARRCHGRPPLGGWDSFGRGQRVCDTLGPQCTPRNEEARLQPRLKPRLSSVLKLAGSFATGWPLSEHPRRGSRIGSTLRCT